MTESRRYSPKVRRLAPVHRHLTISVVLADQLAVHGAVTRDGHLLIHRRNLLRDRRPVAHETRGSSWSYIALATITRPAASPLLPRTGTTRFRGPLAGNVSTTTPASYRPGAALLSVQVVTGSPPTERPSRAAEEPLNRSRAFYRPTQLKGPPLSRPRRAASSSPRSSSSCRFARCTVSPAPADASAMLAPSARARPRFSRRDSRND